MAAKVAQAYSPLMAADSTRAAQRSAMLAQTPPLPEDRSPLMAADSTRAARRSGMAALARL
jgi:hypothetical protein